MSIKWDDYRCFEWPFEPSSRLRTCFNELSREKAITTYERLMSSKEERQLLLTELLQSDELEPSCEPKDVTCLNEWYCREVESSSSLPLKLERKWYSVTLDISLFLAECVRNRAPHLQWSLCTDPPNDVSYHMPVLVGFENVEYEQYHYNMLAGVAAVGHQELFLRNPEAARDSAQSALDKRKINEKLRKLESRQKEHAENSFLDMMDTCMEYA